MSESSLKHFSLFEGVPHDALSALETAAQPRDLSGGDRLIERGNDATTLQFVLSGRLRVANAAGVTVAHIEAGEVVGELAFFADGKRTADVFAMRDTQVLEITREDFERISADHPALTHVMLRLVSQRLVAATARSGAVVKTVPRVIAVLPAGDSKMPDGLLDRLADAIRKAEPSGPGVATMASEGSAPGDYLGWLAEREHEGAYVLADASGAEEWGRAVCRNADALLMVATPHAASPQPSALETAAMDWIEPEDRTLLLLRDAASVEITGSRAWIDARAAKLHHHVALDRDEDFAKVGRFLTGNAVGLVLAGGGALGAAHLGVIKGLQEAGIPYDFIGGTSAGAAMGGAIAQGLSVAEVLDQMEAMFIEAKAMKRLTIPVHALLDHRTFDHELSTRYGSKDIADQPHLFFGISTNLSTNSLHIHRSGPLWECVRASGSLPTILPPFIDADGNILVDGGVLDNIPVRVIRQLKTGPNIIAALGDPTAEWRVDAEYSDVRGPGALLRDLLLRRKPEKKIPSIVETMSNSMVVASRMLVKEMDSPDDAVLEIPLIPGMGIMDWDQGRELAEMARLHVLQQAQGEGPLTRFVA
ncbi:patatin-like phospholipase family protein [Paraurantiacibacter namhicola]|uniref:NTE family protein RssA n=1 Tax=Paraurantiacibacter namhicola TaxID=645517 RepID=A0A1C7DAV0_9SPHN|nr:cyclic nucleotide-binding and patatin-like phospholipase domain-containing protein [Paraurantiacibacter namhicola]ANU08620.1 NTE family protein RssA [Paraurantiacibacter namhicola]